MRPPLEYVRECSCDSWEDVWEAIQLVLYAAYFPLLLVGLFVLPWLLTAYTGLSLAVAIQLSVFVVTAGYVLGFLVVFR